MGTISKKNSFFLSWVLIPLGALTFGGYGSAQTDPLSNFTGVWSSVNPPGPYIAFFDIGLGKRAASLPMGQANLSVSNGDTGSNLMVSGEGFVCYYAVNLINSQEMTWDFKKGDSVCMPSRVLKKVEGNPGSGPLNAAQNSTARDSDAGGSDWRVGMGMGFQELAVKNGPGNQFTIACNLSADTVDGSSIDISILNKGPKGGSQVKIVFDDEVLEFRADKAGSLKINSHVDADNFRVMLENIRRSRNMLVQFSDNRSSKFSLKGAAKIVAGLECKDGYYNF
jgi:hypothetical protein